MAAAAGARDAMCLKPQVCSFDFIFILPPLWPPPAAAAPLPPLPPPPPPLPPLPPPLPPLAPHHHCYHITTTTTNKNDPMMVSAGPHRPTMADNTLTPEMHVQAIIHMFLMFYFYFGFWCFFFLFVFLFHLRCVYKKSYMCCLYFFFLYLLRIMKCFVE